MKTSKVRIGTVAGVLALPLIAILAMVMFFSFSQSGPEQAQAANQGSAVAMELRLPANAEVGSTFTVTVAANLSPNVAIAAFGLKITPSVGVSYDGFSNCGAEVKLVRIDGEPIGTCIAGASGSGQQITVLTQAIAPPLASLNTGTYNPANSEDGKGPNTCSDGLPLDPMGPPDAQFDDGVDATDADCYDYGKKVELANLSYSCDTLGVKTLVLEHASTDALGAQFGDAANAAVILPKSVGSPAIADFASITCVPPAGEININVLDNQLGTTLSDSCFEISFFDVSLSPPAQAAVDVVGDNNKVCTNATGALSDENPVVGEVDVVISGKLLEANGDAWFFQQTQTQAKYTLDNTKYTCTLSGGATKTEGPGDGIRTACDEANVFNISNVLKQGVATINLSGNLGAEEVCFGITGGNITGSKQVCRDGAGSISQNLDMGNYTITIKTSKVATVSQQLKSGISKAQACDLAKTTLAERTCKVSFNFEGQKVFHLKTPSLSNLFLTNQQGEAKNFYPTEAGTTIAPSVCRAGTDVALFTDALSLEPASLDPKGSGATQSVAAFEMEVRYDPQWVCVNIVPGDYWFLQANKTNPFTGNARAAAQAISDSALPVAGGKSPISLTDGSAGVVCFIDDKNDGQQPTGLARIGCVITKGSVKDIDQTLPLAYVLVKPQPEVYNQIIPNQENGIVTMILNSGCNIADLEGHPIDSSGCDDSVLTIRWLEADFNGDCVVNVIDQQLVSSRWGASVGSLLYDARMDTMPYGSIKGDGLINIKDVQFAYGRNGSVCDDQNRFKLTGPPNPAQDPVPNK